MIHAVIQLLILAFEVVGSSLKHDLGAADYRIVRVVFFSAFAAWAAFALARWALDLTHGILRLVTVSIPRSAFRLLCRVVRDLDAACTRFEQQCREWLAAKKRSDHGL